MFDAPHTLCMMPNGHALWCCRGHACYRDKTARAGAGTGYIKLEDMRRIVHNLGHDLSYRFVKDLCASVAEATATGSRDRADRIRYTVLTGGEDPKPDDKHAKGDAAKAKEKEKDKSDKLEKDGDKADGEKVKAADQDQSEEAAKLTAGVKQEESK